MDLRITSNSLSLQNSPMEFVFVGPYGGRDKVILRSDNAKLDVIGLAIMGEEDVDRINFNSNDSLSRYFVNSKSREIHVVQGSPLHDLNIKSDERLSAIQFAWVGGCSSKFKFKIKETLYRFSSDIRRSIINGDIEEIEIAVSPLITLCTKADEVQKRSKREKNIFLLVYTLLIIFMFSALIFQKIFMDK